jgi:hypothetical protein
MKKRLAARTKMIPFAVRLWCMLVAPPLHEPFALNIREKT